MNGGISAPKWINIEFFQKILENSTKGKIINFNIASAAKVGEHIGGNVLRANINYINSENKPDELSVIIKYLTAKCKNDDKLDNKKYETEVQVLKTELKMYSEIIPKFEKMLRNVGDKTVLGPRLLYCSESPHKVIVLEDLTKSGYISVDSDCPNMADDAMAESAFDKLAKLHACSYKLNYENENCLESCDNSIFKVNENEHLEVMGGGIKQLIKALTPIINEDPKLKDIIEMLEKIQGKVYKKCTNLYEYSKTHTKLNVLNHGDFHFKNLMLKYDDKHIIEDVQILDFAMCFWSSMAFDLFYIIYAIYAPEFRKTRRDEIIYRYFKKFENSLKLIGFNGKLPKFSDLLYDITQLGHLELWLTTTFLPFCYGFISQKNSNIEEFTKHEDARFAMYKIPEFLKDIENILKSSLNYGFLDESYYQ